MSTLPIFADLTALRGHHLFYPIEQVRFPSNDEVVLRENREFHAAVHEKDRALFESNRRNLKMAVRKSRLLEPCFRKSHKVFNLIIFLACISDFCYLGCRILKPATMIYSLTSKIVLSAVIQIVVAGLLPIKFTPINSHNSRSTL